MRDFYKELFRQFKNIGALTPSSPALAKAMADALPSPFNGTLVELGPGTGAITKGLIVKGIKPQQIIAIEQSEKFTKIIQKKFPKIVALHGSAETLSELIGELDKTIDAIVSSLPLRSIPIEVVNTMMNEIDKVLPSGGHYIQFTYGRKPNPILQKSNFKLIKSVRVLGNLPPARVDVIQKI